jgi:queuine tRNA-ribosyltransferase
MPPLFSLVKEAENSAARAGVLKTAHGEIETPNLFAAATHAATKALSPAQLKEIGAPGILANTFHLLLRPGPEVISKLGGLHRFAGWEGPIFTDSGGFQVFSLGHLLDAPGNSAEVKGLVSRAGVRKKSLLAVTEEGCLFKSPLDGAEVFLSPEKAIRAQLLLGADIIVAFDELSPYHFSKEQTRASMERTHRWLARCVREADSSWQLANSKKPNATSQKLFGVVQGGVHLDLRKESAEFIAAAGVDGICIGGCLGTSKEEEDEIVARTISFLPEGKARHLLGIGDGIEDFLRGIDAGVDTFDCVAPTRNARHGSLFSSEEGKLQITNARFREDPRPIDESCDCPTCRQFSRAYLHHLFRAREPLALTLASQHNLAFLFSFLKRARAAILAGKWQEFRQEEENKLTR